MKKILIFSLNYYPRFIGGAEVAIKEITDRISPEEIEFHVVTLRFDANLPREEVFGNVHVHRIGFVTVAPSITDLSRYPLKLNKYYFQIFAARTAEHLHKKYHFDAIWAMMAHSSGIPAGIFKKKHPEVKYLLTLQEGDPPAYTEKLMKPVWRLFVQGFILADALQPISTFLAAWGVRMGFSHRYKVIPNAVDIKRFTHQFTDSETESMKKELGKKEGEVFLVTTSRLVLKNAVDDVIRAIALLPKEIIFLVYGIGPDEEKLHELAKELKVEDRVRFMGQISHADMPRMLSACDIFIRPSRSEGMGNSFIEAMAAGLPVIATHEGGIPDFLFDNKRNPGVPTTGWAVDANSPEQIVTAVQDILNDPERVLEVTKTARAMVIQKYDWNTVAADMKRLFDDLLSSK